MSVRSSLRGAPVGVGGVGILRRWQGSALLMLAACGLAACSGGGTTTGSAGVDCGTAGATVICLESCNLGCSTTGCAQTDIAQNQIVILNFSEAIDPVSVNTSSIRFRTPTGNQPVGEFVVDGRTVKFLPSLSISGGQTFFGFTSGETYTMTILGGDSQTSVVRSTSGRPFDRTLSCTLRSTVGIVDLNGVAPRGELVVPSPSQIGAAPLDTDIVIEFNELIDATPFLSGTQSPVNFSIRRNRETAPGSGVFECNPNSPPQILSGTQVLDFDAARGISILSFRPTQSLPGNVCIEVSITDGVADLSGRPAQPQTLTFRTAIVPQIEDAVVEPFDNEDQLDDDQSAAVWTGGTATFLAIGGDGRHGPFSLALCTDTLTTVEGKRVYTFNTDNTVIPGSNTTTGNPIAVTDGRFFFTSMVVPSDARIQFVGTRPPQITASGRLDVLGHLDIAGVNASASVPGSLPGSTTLVGAPGTAGGAGGGAGGKGGDKVTQAQATSSGATAINNGVNGQDARVLAGHAYVTSVANTGGRGSACYPVSGLNTGVYYGFSTAPGSLLYSPMTASGGGGGGYLTTGLPGTVVTNNHTEPGLAGLVVLAATATTVTAATAGTNQPAWPWLPNRYAGRTLEILSGVTVVESRTIVSNSGTNNATFTVSAPWTTTPAIGTSFRVVGVPTAPFAYAMGPNTNGGAAVTLFPIPTAPGSQPSSQHFLVGGSGGGGGGSHASFSLSLLTDRFIAGCGGGGGGGAISLRAGRTLTVAPAAKVLANGGSALNSVGTTTSNQQACVGGGGSGGSVVLQSGNAFQTSGGLIDVRGGTGGLFQRSTTNPLPPAGASVQMQGGNGASGFVRFEAPTAPTLAALSGMQPAATADNVGTLTERDTLVLCQSKYYSTQQIFGPEFVRYEIRGTVDGVPFVLSDDPSVSPLRAEEGQPVRAQFQAAQLNVSTGVVEQVGPWRQAVKSNPNVTGIDADSLNGFRFRMVADRALGAVITLDEVRVVFRY
jgi:hypothetical protein